MKKTLYVYETRYLEREKSRRKLTVEKVSRDSGGSVIVIHTNDGPKYSSEVTIPEATQEVWDKQREKDFPTKQEK